MSVLKDAVLIVFGVAALPFALAACALIVFSGAAVFDIFRRKK